MNAYEQSVSADVPFFDAEACAKTAIWCCSEARKRASEYRSQGRIADYQRKIRDAWWYRKRARLWRLELETEE